MATSILTLSTSVKTFVICSCSQVVYIINDMDSDQNAPEVVLWSGLVLFASMKKSGLWRLECYMQQT